MRFPFGDDGAFWYGGLVEDGILMPYGGKPLERDLSCVRTHNQYASFLISDTGSWVWSDTPFAYRFDGKGLTVEGKGVLRQEKGNGIMRDGFLSAVGTCLCLNGKMPDPLLFSRPQYNTWIPLMYDQREERILDYAQSIVEAGYPPGVLMIDDNWQEDYGTWRWKADAFPHPKSLVDKLHSLGFKVMLWTCPFVSPDSATFRLLEGKGFLVREKGGECAVRKWWNGHSAVLDLLDAGAVSWFHDALSSLMDAYGVDGFKFDGGDPATYRDDDDDSIPSSPADQCKAYSAFAGSFPLAELRSGYGSPFLPVSSRQCDKNHTWGKSGLSGIIPSGLAQGLIGLPYGCPDMVGGGEYLDFLPGKNTLDEELVVRYAQASALFPMMQFSLAPWEVLSKEHNAICRKMVSLRQDFVPLILSLAQHAAKTGEPVMRSLCYQYGSAYANVMDEFLLGNEVLVAPCIRKGERERNVVLPSGSWRDDLGHSWQGPVEIVTDVPLPRLPYYRRES